jgi:hypothetical protein
MTETRESAVKATAAKQRKSTKSATVIKLLWRVKGATVIEIMRVTKWQPHTCRAFLTGLRKAGKTLLKEERPDGKLAYRIETAHQPSTGDA